MSNSRAASPVLPTSPTGSQRATAPGPSSAGHARTIFVGEGTPRHELLRSPRSDSNFSSNSPPSSALPQQQSFALPPPSSIHPLTSLELRVRWLEALVSGVSLDSRGSSSKATEDAEIQRVGLLKRAAEVQDHLNEIVEANAQLRRFMSSFDEYEQVLTPSFALSPSGAGSSATPSYEDLNKAELDALLKDMEPELRAADRDLREIQALDKHGATGAGQLGDHEPLIGRLNALVQANLEDERKYREIEERAAALLQRYSSHVTALSELFVYWNDSVTDAEDFMTRVEKADREKAKKAFA